MTLLSENIRCMQIFADFRQGSAGRGRQIALGSSTTAIFGDFAGYFFGNVTDKTIRLSVLHGNMLHPCRPEIRCKMNDLQ